MRAYRIGLHGALLAILAACGASEKMAPASVDQPKPAPGPTFANLAIVDGGPLVGMHFTHFGVNPTVDTREQPASTFGLSADQASVGLVQLQMGKGRLPDRGSVRVEDFVNALTAPPATVDPRDLFAIDSALLPSPTRPGYDVLRVTLTARPAATPRRVFVVLDAAATRAPEVRDIVARLVSGLTPADAISVVHRGRTVAVPIGPVTDPRTTAAIARLTPTPDAGWRNIKAAQALARDGGQVVYINDGLANRDQPMIDRLLGMAPSRAKAAWTVIGLGRGPYDDGRLVQLATAMGGRYLYTDRSVPLTPEQLVPRPVAAFDARAHAQFDPDAVTRYRLLGHERADTPGGASTGAQVAGGATATVLWEVKRTGNDKPLGSLMIRATDAASGAPVLQRFSLAPPRQPSFAAAPPFSRQAVIAAALAEKLRSAYWVRGVGYPTLRALLDAIPADQRDATLDRMLTRAQALDTRGDAYARQGPIAQMSFDHVPIVRR